MLRRRMDAMDAIRWNHAASEGPGERQQSPNAVAGAWSNALFNTGLLDKVALTEATGF